MKEWLSKLLVVVVLLVSVHSAVYAESTRVNGSPDYPGRKLALQFNTSLAPLYNGNPNTGSLTTTSATGRVPNDGIVHIALCAGFTPPMTVTVWWWSIAEAKWIHAGPGVTDYSKAFDATYTSCQFTAPPQAAYIVTTNAANTGSVYVSGRAYKDNANSAAGFDQ